MIMNPKVCTQPKPTSPPPRPGRLHDRHGPYVRKTYEVWLGTQLLGSVDHITAAEALSQYHAKNLGYNIQRFEIRIRHA